MIKGIIDPSLADRERGRPRVQSAQGGQSPLRSIEKTEIKQGMENDGGRHTPFHEKGHGGRSSSDLTINEEGVEEDVGDKGKGKKSGNESSAIGTLR